MDHCKSTANEKYQIKLKEKKERIEDAIENVSKLRKDLEENCRNVKLEVQKSVSLKIEQMRQREMQLLRQVDALIGHQSALLQMHLSYLYQTLGSFKAASQWVELGSKVYKIPTLNEEDLETVSPCLIHYQSDENDLSLAIQVFGSLEAKGTPAKVFLLPEEEEYGDGDHHVMHKTLQEDNQTKIKVSFPKINGKLEDWLPSTTTVIHNIEDLELNSSCSQTSEVSESIEMLSHSELTENLEWLQTNNNGSTCSCQNVGNIEIENLDSLLCIPNAVNFTNTKKPDEVFLQIPPIASICKSNSTEKCCSYDSCVCGNSCLVTSLKKRLIEMEIRDSLQQQDCINTAIKNSISKQWLNSLEEQSFADKKWLASISKSKTTSVNDEWLPKEKQFLKESFGKFTFPKIFDISDTSMWLKKSTFIKSKELSEKVDEIKERSCGLTNQKQDLWLAENKERNDNSYTIKNKSIKATFDVFVKPINNEAWLFKNGSDNVQDRSG